MITAWLTRRREAAAARWLEESRIARLLAADPIGVHAQHHARIARRRLRRWDRLLDAWTQNGRR